MVREANRPCLRLRNGRLVRLGPGLVELDDTDTAGEEDRQQVAAEVRNLAAAAKGPRF